MKPEWIVGFLIGIAIFCTLVALLRADEDMHIGRRLRKSAGNDPRLIQFGIEAAYMEAIARQRPVRDSKVVRIYPRIKNGGRVVRFERDPGSAA